MVRVRSATAVIAALVAVGTTVLVVTVASLLNTPSSLSHVSPATKDGMPTGRTVDGDVGHGEGVDVTPAARVARSVRRRTSSSTTKAVPRSKSTGRPRGVGLPAGAYGSSVARMIRSGPFPGLATFVPRRYPVHDRLPPPFLERWRAADVAALDGSSAHQCRPEIAADELLFLAQDSSRGAASGGRSYGSPSLMGARLAPLDYMSHYTPVEDPVALRKLTREFSYSLPPFEQKVNGGWTNGAANRSSRWVWLENPTSDAARSEHWLRVSKNHQRDEEGLPPLRSGGRDRTVRRRGAGEQRGGGNGVRATAAVDQHLPCFFELQRRLWLHQHPVSCRKARFLASRLKEGAHGVGSAITLLAHDLLAAVTLDRILWIPPPKQGWFFAPRAGGCRTGGWECLFVSATWCEPPADRRGEVIVRSLEHARKQASSTVVRKAEFDIPGLSRSDHPELRAMFGEALWKRCAANVTAWLDRHDVSTAEGKESAAGDADGGDRREPKTDAAAVMVAPLMGTFAGGADPTLAFLLGHATAYLMRGLQPWFAAMLRAKLQLVLPPSLLTSAAQSSVDDKDEGVCGGTAMWLYVQDRGEPAKYREYYNTFGCHKVERAAFVDVGREMCAAHRRQVAAAGGSSCTGRCNVYVSGNTPSADYEFMREAFVEPLPAAADGRGSSIATVGSAFDIVASTWQLAERAAAAVARGAAAEVDSTNVPVADDGASSPPAAAVSESARWGAAAPEAGWTDLYAATLCNRWACIAQSNWCRVVHFLRAGYGGRTRCPFVDLGVTMLAGGKAVRDRYCVFNASWPSKPYRNAKSW